MNCFLDIESVLVGSSINLLMNYLWSDNVVNIYYGIQKFWNYAIIGREESWINPEHYGT